MSAAPAEQHLTFTTDREAYILATATVLLAGEKANRETIEDALTGLLYEYGISAGAQVLSIFAEDLTNSEILDLFDKARAVVDKVYA